MELWIIQQGEKIGPLHDFEVRKRIENGELSATTPAWHDGMPAWKPLVEISLFEREFERTGDGRDPSAAAESGAGPGSSAPESLSPPPLSPPRSPARTLLIRRFWARWFDLYLFGGVWWLMMWATGRDIGATLLNPWVILLQYVPWFVLESFLLHRFGTTPGKWLLGIQVVNDDSSRLSLAAATRRSARVLFIGLGFGWGVLTLICQIMACFTALRIGRPLWDHAGGHRIIAVPLNALRIIAYVFFLYGSLQLQMVVVAPYIFPYVLEATKNFPALQQQLKDNPPWHLPK